MEPNIITSTDAYKVSHHLQYPPGTEKVYCYFESRGGKFPGTLFFGLQYILKRHLVGQVVTAEKIEQAEKFFSRHLRTSTLFNSDGWKHILEAHDGYLPLRIKAVPEGTIVPTRNVLFTVENTDPKVPWLTGYVETLLCQVWYPLTVATGSRVQKEVLRNYLSETADSLDALPFLLHDFGFRGASSFESAAIGGAAHMVNFLASDTIGAGARLLEEYYDAGDDPIGFSGAAQEHSTITTWREDNELEGYRNMFKRFPPSSAFSLVVDSYNVWRACEDLLGTQLKDLIVEKGKHGGMLGIRPDSGDPATVVVKVLNILGEKFGFSTNSKGFRRLPPYLVVVQGDGISYETLKEVLEALKQHKWSVDNVAFGSGGGLLQKVNRDTQKCAYKCSYMEANGEGREVFKNPVTDPGKMSKRGKLTLEWNPETQKFRTLDQGKGDDHNDVLEVVFENGRLIREHSLRDIRKRSDSGLDILSLESNA